MKVFSILAPAVALVLPVTAFWRMPCRGVSGLARIDPLVSPGQVADHAHIIFGGGNFGMSSTSAELRDSECTSTGVLEDKSAYWTPALYFQFANGSVEMVNNVGGMLAYYQLNLPNLTAFPEGFQMIAGNPTLRTFNGPFPDIEESAWPTETDPNNQTWLQQRALGFNCLNYSPGFQTEPTMYRHQFPDRAYLDANCIDGLRLEIGFPSCGNGSADSTDHKSHVKYPTLVKEGNCPEGYDVHYPFMMYETIWDTYHYAGVAGQFVLATGDPVGPSYHGDFIMGWKSADFLQQAIKECTNESGEISDCPLFTLQADEDATKCQFKMPNELKDEDCKGPIDSLPVDVPIQSGPGPATKYNVVGRVGVSSTAIPSSSVQLPSPPATIPIPTHSSSDLSVSISTTVTVPGSGGKPANVQGPNGGPPNQSHSGFAHDFNVAAAASTKASTLETTTSTAEAPAITSAPSSSSTSLPHVSTIWNTSGGKVLEMIFVESPVFEEVTVIVTPTPSASDQRKRHLGAHKHHHF